jgi:hypothetical protein
MDKSWIVMYKSRPLEPIRLCPSHPAATALFEEEQSKASSLNRNISNRSRGLCGSWALSKQILSNAKNAGRNVSHVRLLRHVQRQGLQSNGV